MDQQQKINALIISRQLGGKTNVSTAVAAYALLDENNEEIEFIVRRASITLTDAEILTLPSSPPVVVPAPGLGKSIQIISARIVIDNTGGIYTGVDPTLQVYLRLNTGGVTVSSLLDIGWILEDGSAIGIAETFGAAFTTIAGSAVNGSSDYISAYDNRALTLIADNGSPANTNFGGGDPANTLKLTVYYVIVDLR